METQTEVKQTETENIQNDKNITTAEKPVEQETPEQINWKKFREAREIERKQKIEAEKRAAEKDAEVQAYKAAMEALLNKQTEATTLGNYADSQEIGEEEKIRRQVEAIIAERDRKNAEAQREAELRATPQRIQQAMPDFNQVCSEENVDYLEYHYPEIAQAFSAMPEGFDKWANIYKAVKRFVPNTNSNKEATRAEKNLQKPGAISIPGKTQVGDTAPQYLDDKRKMDNWQRMQRVMRGG